MKKIFIIIFIMLSIIAMSSCSDKKKNSDNEEDSIWPLDVSIIQLIANPAEYHGKKIQVKGVGNLSFEGTSVYLCIDNWYYGASKNALWLSIEQKFIENENSVYFEDVAWYYLNGEWISYKDAQEHNGKYVLIEGTFDMYATGHRDLFSGRIYDITRFNGVSNSNRGMEMNPEDYYIGNVDDWAEENINPDNR